MKKILIGLVLVFLLSGCDLLKKEMFQDLFLMNVITQ